MILVLSCFILAYKAELQCLTQRGRLFGIDIHWLYTGVMTIRAMINVHVAKVTNRTGQNQVHTSRFMHVRVLYWSRLAS